jgi:hypothetical protein
MTETLSEGATALQTLRAWYSRTVRQMRAVAARQVARGRRQQALQTPQDPLHWGLAFAVIGEGL